MTQTWQLHEAKNKLSRVIENAVNNRGVVRWVDSVDEETLLVQNVKRAHTRLLMRKIITLVL
jgi:hypothetical protein